MELLKLIVEMKLEILANKIYEGVRGFLNDHAKLKDSLDGYNTLTDIWEKYVEKKDGDYSGMIMELERFYNVLKTKCKVKDRVIEDLLVYFYETKIPV